MTLLRGYAAVERGVGLLAHARAAVWSHAGFPDGFRWREEVVLDGGVLRRFECSDDEGKNGGNGFEHAAGEYAP